MKWDPPRTDEENFHLPTTVIWDPVWSRSTSLQSCSHQLSGGHMVLCTTEVLPARRQKMRRNPQMWLRKNCPNETRLSSNMFSMPSYPCLFLLPVSSHFALLLYPTFTHTFSSPENVTSINQDVSLVSNSERRLEDDSPSLVSFHHTD